jgi:hypothetical protein
MVGLAEEFKGSNVELKPDFKDLLRLLNHHEVRYLIAGYAVMKYTEPFYTKAMDIWVEPAEETPNEHTLRWWSSAPMADLTVHDLTQPHIVFQSAWLPPVWTYMTTIDAVTIPCSWKIGLRRI